MTSYIKPITQNVVDRILDGECTNPEILSAILSSLGFAIRVGAKRSAYIVEKRIGKGDKPSRKKIGTVGR